ncbi:protocadherin-11 X-linked [Striga asiatica]|uniref:Protocadherin-11 X-linked n=1 Tax=Striga asiatica TaxID=4170 RepID=A0A5A7Q5M1_STRAF|nr:protocadherin-11 X-linked [Striga asiatica]
MEVNIGAIGHAGSPIGRGNVVSNDSLVGRVRGYFERERLAVKGSKSLVRSSPVMAHAYPACLASLHPHACYVPTTRHIHHVHEQPISIALEHEPKPALSDAWHSAGLAMSKWVRGGLHHPPWFESCDQFGGQRLVAVTVVMGDPL